MGANGERSISQVLQDIVGNIQEILRSEFQLAKAEVKEEIAAAAKPLAMLGVGLLFLVYAVGLLLIAAVFGLATVMKLWSAALVVGAGTAIVAVILINGCRGGLKKVSVTSDRLIASLQEQARWAKKQTD